MGDEAKNESSDSGSDDEYDPHYEPLMQLPIVDVKTLEEDEECLWDHRGQLYRYDDSVEPGEWKQRGTGMLKLLKHKTIGYVRLLMRRDVTFKVCANHYILPNLQLRKHDKSPRTWVWYTPADFADEEPKAERLAVRFKDVDTFEDFESHFNEAKSLMEEYHKKMLACKKTDGDGDKKDNEEKKEEDVEKKDQAAGDGFAAELAKKVESLHVD